MDTQALLKTVVNAIYSVRRELLPGYLESVYKNALAYELSQAGIKYQSELAIPVMYKGVKVGDFRCDLLVENQLIVELKATSALTVIDEIQLVNNLATTGVDLGLLLNFGADELEIKRKRRVFTKY